MQHSLQANTQIVVEET